MEVLRTPDFSDLRYSLDATMKLLQTLGVGSKHRQAEVLAEKDEEMLYMAVKTSVSDIIIMHTIVIFPVYSP